MSVDAPSGSLPDFFATAVSRGVFGHVTDVGNVHDMLDAVTKQFECPSQDVCVQEGAEIPDMRVVVDGGSAGVKSQQR